MRERKEALSSRTKGRAGGGRREEARRRRGGAKRAKCVHGRDIGKGAKGGRGG